MFAGVLDANGTGAQKLRGETSGRLQVLQLDVTNDKQIEAAHDHICAQVGDAGEVAQRGLSGSEETRF